MRHDPSRLREAQLVQRVVAAQVHDVDGSPGHLRDRQRAVRPFRLQAGGTGQGMVLGAQLPPLQRDAHQLVDDDPVLRVHAHQGAVLAGLAQRPEDGRVVGRASPPDRPMNIL